ncbi:hypothetical protein GL218_07918 [Daldinia childiae]|uniref:uncharacterized protein n=1 Tax=Daldinia childiae TaxID=326645 RepID=UPI001444BE08|nr:uncharacterized protein GL218_07918 [Daldinia childiae]KAF3069766.1 hypothetical protein GL218_07918 [Daldinia childiae]
MYAGRRSERIGSTAALLDDAITGTVSRILSAQQPWTWRGKESFGTAHGTIGIMCQLVLSQPSIASRVEGILSDLLATQLLSGNFPSSARSKSDRVVRFWHGGPGLVISLSSLELHFLALKKWVWDAVGRAVALGKRSLSIFWRLWALRLWRI